MGTASGHFKPKMNLLPHYLESLLIQSLFPDFKIEKLNKKGKYQPLKMVGYRENPWHDTKATLFPVLKGIHKRDRLKITTRHNVKINALVALLRNKTCENVIDALAERMHVFMTAEH